MFDREPSHQETRSLVALMSGVAVLLAVGVFFSAPAQTAVVTYAPPQTQTAGFFDSIGSFFSSVGSFFNQLSITINCNFLIPTFGSGGSCSGGGGGGNGVSGGKGAEAVGGKQIKGGGAIPTANGNGSPLGGTNGGVSGGGVPQACQSAAANSCGMHGNGFLDANSNCNATPPPDSACPAPSIGSFYANPARVQKNATSILYWSVTQATRCALSGGGLSLSSLGITGQQPTNAITDSTDFTLTCQEGSGPSSSQSTNVGLIPSYQEI
jgi:hypothetical protein